MGIAAAGASLLSAVAKSVVGRERPPEPLHLAHVVTASFPSGHAPQAAATYLAVAVVATYCLRRKWIVAVWSAAVVVAAVGVSRVYLGVHWATDVLGGWLLGALWVGGLIVSFQPMRHRALHGEVVSARRSWM
jgi:membrane-associated phospholipid phosphatase